MKTARYSDAQIMGILKQAEGGVPVSELWVRPNKGT
jgi:putative transposase